MMHGTRPGESDPMLMLALVILLVPAVVIVAVGVLWWLL